MWRRDSNFQSNGQYYYVYKPSGWRAVVFKSKRSDKRVVFFYSPVYFFKVAVPDASLKFFFDPNSNTFNIHTMYMYNTYRLFSNQLERVFTAFFQPFFRKIKFKGKGYYIYKNTRNTITPQFGYSHRLYLYSPFVTVKFLSKTSIFVFGLLKNDVITTSLGIKAMRPINIFTGRGVRFSREVVYKKVGKVSSYR
jgi:ribosomal protein L6P/L9E